jgi:predicted transposase/invertase (TIGR01784 family)
MENKKEAKLNRDEILAAISITMDPVFKWVMEQKDNCLKFVQAALPELNIVEISFQTQKKMHEFIESKAIITDILAKDDQNRIFDIEMQVALPTELGKRIRYYQDVLDISNTSKGTDYKNLVETYIIFIFTEDPFGYDFKRYTSKGIAFNEAEGLLLQNGTHLVMLNPRGTKGKVTPEMQQFFDLELGILSQQDDYAKQLQDSMVDFTKDPERVKQVMTFQDKLEDYADAAAKKDSIKRLRNNILMLQELQISNDKIRSRMHQEYSDVLSPAEIDKYLAVLDK